MRSINLSSYSDAFKTLDEAQFIKYLDYFGVQVKAQESEDIYSFVTRMISNGLFSDQLTDFFVGYSIPQISKEFDLLRFGHNYILDIELKNISTEERIATQLIQNSYYLRALGTPVITYAFVVKTQDVFTLDENGNLMKRTMKELVNAVGGQQSKGIDNIDALFKPSVYLVSPLNSPEKFISGSYFLTGNQLAARYDIIRIFADNSVPVIAIEGKPGTGKTLLTYDIARYFVDQRWNVCLFHCGYLAEGHYILMNEYKWNIYPIRDLDNVLQQPQKCNLIIVDEAQRVYSNQLEAIINYINERKIKCIFSYDPEQVFSSSESLRNIAGRVEQLLHKKYRLTEKIRTNKEIASFITNLFNRKQNSYVAILSS